MKKKSRINCYVMASRITFNPVKNHIYMVMMIMAHSNISTIQIGCSHALDFHMLEIDDTTSLPIPRTVAQVCTCCCYPHYDSPVVVQPVLQNPHSLRLYLFLSHLKLFNDWIYMGWVFFTCCGYETSGSTDSTSSKIGNCHHGSVNT